MEKILAQGGDYLLAVKGYQGTQYEICKEFFAIAEKEKYAGIDLNYLPKLLNLKKH